MKRGVLSTLTVILSSAIVLLGTNSCIGNEENGGSATSKTTVDFKSNGKFLKDFKHNKVSVYKGVTVNGTSVCQSINIGIANCDIKPGSFGGFMFPIDTEKGNALFWVKLEGKRFEKGEKAFYLKEGDEFAYSNPKDYRVDVVVQLPDYVPATLVEFNSTAFTGTAKITSLTDNHVEGVVEFAHNDGEASLKVNFSEDYTDNWTDKGYD